VDDPMNSSWSEELNEFRKRQITLIIEAAERVFLGQGLAQTKMTEIAAEAGISRPTLYKYFSTLDDLAFTVQMRSLDMLNETIREYTAHSQGSAIEKIELLFEACLAFYGTHPEHLRFSTLFDTYFRNNYNSQQSEQRYTAFLKKFSELEKLIQKGQQDGTIRPGLDPHNTAFMIENTMLAMLQRMALRGELIHREQDVVPLSQLVEMFTMMKTYLEVVPTPAP
jgi:AcrR family transcriptional regulator